MEEPTATTHTYTISNKIAKSESPFNFENFSNADKNAHKCNNISDK